MRLRRARSVVSYWRGGKLVFENYLTRRSITADPLTTLVLDMFDEWRSPRELSARMESSRRTNLDRAIQQLIRHTFLLPQGSPEASRDARLAKAWAPWLPHAGLFHFGSKDVVVRSTKQDVRRMLRGFLAASPQPAFFKSQHKALQVRLPKPLLPVSRDEAQGNLGGDPGELFRVLLARRTQREFSTKALSLENLSQLLFYTWGITGCVRVPLLGCLPLKTSPSGGARHPGEVYVLALRVDGLRPGLYYYSPGSHSLERIRLGRMQNRAVQYCGGQTWVGKAAALFFMTAVLKRTMWKYRASRAYRIVLTEAGHFCQVFYLVATALGFAPFCTMAIADSLIEKDLGLDGIEEPILYVAGCGRVPSVNQKIVCQPE